LPLDRPLAGLGRWLGSGGLATLQLLWGWGLWQLWRRRGRRCAWWLISLLLAHAMGALSLSPPPALAALRLGAWQPAIPTREKFSPERQRRFQSALSSALQQAQSLKVEALVAPEGTLPFRWQADEDPLPVPLISGGFRWVRGQQRSSVLLARPDRAGVEPLVDKHRLVPLGEWLPPLPAGLTRGLSAVGGLQPGDASRFVNVWPSPFAVAICYEISDGRALAKATAQGAEWLLTIANLDPYPQLLQRQFLALAQLRAIETGRDVLSVANTGPTALVSADGTVQRLLEPQTDAVAAAELQRRQQLTGYSRLVWAWSSR
jgi:apolipoprotein N-acyltransferase